MTRGTALAGTATTIKSILTSGIDFRLGKAFTPRTDERLGFTGYTTPPKGELIRFQKIVLPTEPFVSEAPITATTFGANIESSI
ncbi:hypothetical protein HK096_004862 [Nowakowskiella sp. JEL0078]|nr:hypothetical protein HK096_004862 [Nowakowskiella sp. JEL0078]